MMLNFFLLHEYKIQFVGLSPKGGRRVANTVSLSINIIVSVNLS